MTRNEEYDNVAVKRSYNNVQYVNEEQGVQEAHDALPAYPDGGRLIVTSDYDETLDSLPITLDTPLVMQGDGWGQGAMLDYTSHPDASTNPAFDLGIKGTTGNQNYPMRFSNLSIWGGLSAFRFQERSNVHMDYVLMRNQTEHGVDWGNSDFSGWATFFHCRVNSCEIGPAWEMRGANEAPNNVTFEECHAEVVGDGTTSNISDGWSGDPGGTGTPYGVGVALAGFGTTWRGGNVKECEGPGIIFADGSGGDVLVDATYFESNGIQRTGRLSSNIFANAGTGLRTKSIHNTYHTPGGTPADYALYLDQNSGWDVQNLRGDIGSPWSNGPPIASDGNAEPVYLDVDQDRVDLSGINGSALVYWGGHGGVIQGGPLGGTDLGSLTDARTGDRAMSVGTGSGGTAPRGNVVWTFDGTDWVSPDSSESNITPA